MNRMRFIPGGNVVLQSSDGLVIVATPFFYTDLSKRGLQTEFYVTDGTKLRCIDESKGVYSRAETGPLLYVKSGRLQPSAPDGFDQCMRVGGSR